MRVSKNWLVLDPMKLEQLGAQATVVLQHSQIRESCEKI